jgi:hypothetical protein
LWPRSGGRAQASLSGADTGMVSTVACPRCVTALGLSRWCEGCGLDLRPDLPATDIPEARHAATQQNRWIAAHPQAVAPQPFLPPAGAGAQGASLVDPTPRFAPLGSRSRLAVRWLWVAIAVGVGTLAIDGIWLQEHATSDWTYDDMLSIARLMDTASIVQLVTYVIGGVIFIVWFHRAYRNLAALGVEKPRRGLGWAIGGWFVPIANMFIPKQLANDVWRAGDPALRQGDPNWQARPVSPLLHWWWALWLSSSAAAYIAGRLQSGAETFDAFRPGVLVDAASQVLGILAALAAIAVITRATKRQETRARVLDAPAAAL